MPRTHLEKEESVCCHHLLHQRTKGKILDTIENFRIQMESKPKSDNQLLVSSSQTILGFIWFQGKDCKIDTYAPTLTT